MPAAFSMRVFMPQVEPQGLRIVEKTNWTGVGLIFPRSRLDKAREREEMRRTGVYVLWNDDDSNQPTVYVGQSEDLSRRPKEHFDKSEMDWWTKAAAFATKDDAFNQAHARYLEWALVERAREANRCELRNQLGPSKPSVSEADQADAEHFFDDLVQCLPLVGLDAFDRAVEQARTSNHNSESLKLHLRLPKVGIRATAIPGVNTFTLCKGGQVRRDEDLPDGFQKEYKRYREYRSQLIEDGTIADVGKKFLEFTADHTFRSPSQANVVIAGGPMQPYKVWKDASGRSWQEIIDGAGQASE